MTTMRWRSDRQPWSAHRFSRSDTSSRSLKLSGKYTGHLLQVSRRSVGVVDGVHGDLLGVLDPLWR